MKRGVARHEALPDLFLFLALQQSATSVCCGCELADELGANFRDRAAGHYSAIVNKVGLLSGKLFLVEGE